MTVASQEIGANNPPPDCPFDAMAKHIGDLIDEASNFLDGEPIATQGQADAIDVLLDGIKEAAKDLEIIRKRENEPFDKGKAAVQAVAKPLAALLDTAKKTANEARTPWLQAQQAERDAIAEAARKEAAELAAKALDQFQATRPTDLQARYEVEELLARAGKATSAANRIDKTATGMRTYWTGTVTDYVALLAYLKKSSSADLKHMLDEYVTKQVNAGVRIMPGVLIADEKRAA